MSDLFTIAHVAQLHEIQRARLKRRKPGIGPEVQELIRRLTDGGVAHIGGDPDDARYAQAKRYWDSGVGKALGYPSFKDYLANIPTPRQLPITNRTQLHPQLLLVEPRVSFAKLCELVGITRRPDWVEERNGDVLVEAPFWAAYDDGTRWRGVPIAKFLKRQAEVDCDSSRADGARVHGFTAFLAVCAYVQDRTIIRVGMGTQHDPYYLHLVGTHHEEHGYATFIMAPGGEPQLWDGSTKRQACPAYGIPSYVRL